MRDSRTFTRRPSPIVVVLGEIDLATGDGLNGIIREAEAYTGDVAIDLRHVSFIDSSVLTALLAAAERAREKGFELIVLTEAPLVRRTLALMRLDESMTISPQLDGHDRPEAVVSPPHLSVVRG